MSAPEGSGSLMSPAEMKPLLLLSKREPVSAVIGLTKGKEGVVFLAKKVKPRKLVAQVKKQAADAKIELDMTSLRFGRASVDSAVDSALVTFTVNKEAAGALKPKLLPQLKKVGFAKCAIVVDASLENEDDDSPVPHDGAALGAGAPAAPGAVAAAPVMPGLDAPAGQGALPPTGLDDAALADDADAGSEADAGDGQGVAAAPVGAAAPTGAPATAEAAAAPPAGEHPDRTELTRRITDEVKRLMPILASNPSGADAMRTAALAAQAALKSGDMEAAARAADALDQLLAASPAGGAAPGAPQPGAPGAKPANPAVFDKAQAAWVATRAKVQGEFNKLFAEIGAVYDGHGVVAELEKSFHSQVQPVMQQLDQNLSGKLRELSSNPDPSSHSRLVQEAQQIIVSYEQYIAGDALLSQLDQNPFVPLAAQKTLVASLATLAKAVH